MQRHVQRQPSVRRQWELSPTAHNPLSHTHRTDEIEDFFEHLKSILHKQENMQRAVQSEVLGDIAPPPEITNETRHLTAKSKTEMALLFEEAIYTVVIRAGVPSSELVACDRELYSYLRMVFEIDPGDLDITLQRVQESKKANYSLKVSVMRAKNLLAKDANGFSDPYCMLGMVLGQRPQEPEERKERRFSFRKKRDKLEKLPSVKESLPAKCIQVTEVKHETLNPEWNEHFVFEVDDLQTDLLHLDIWDHDDDVSVAEACRKLNEVSGFKGMGRYFKQIAKSVRTNDNVASAADGNMDDFLGCLNIPVSEVPVEGCDKWFNLDPRSSSSKVQGECHLILKLFTTQRHTALSQMDTTQNIHEKLLGQIVAYEHQQVQTQAFNWDGRLSKPARIVLSYHAAQTNLSPLQQAVIREVQSVGKKQQLIVQRLRRWRCYSYHHQHQPLCYSFLLSLLSAVEEEWEPSAVCAELEAHLAQSFNLHIDHCLLQLRNLRQVFPCCSSAAVTRCEFLLRGLRHLQMMKSFKALCPLRTELHREITAIIKKAAVEWYEKMLSLYRIEDGTLEEQLKHLVQVVDAACADVQQAQDIYKNLFYSSLRVDFFTVTYQKLEKLVAGSTRLIMEKVCGMLEQEGCHMSQAMGQTLLELYMSLRTFKLFREFLPVRDVKMLALTGYHDWFKTSVHKWLKMIHKRSGDRIHKGVTADQLEPANTHAKHSPSALHVTDCFSHIWDFWRCLAWPDSAEAFIFCTRLTDDVCSAALLYTELLKHKLELISHQEEGKDNKKRTVQMCMALNDIEHVRTFLGNLPQLLDSQGPENAIEENHNKAVKSRLCTADLDLQREAKGIATQLTDKMVVDLKKYIQRISLSPDSINDDDAVSPLMKYLDDTLMILNEILVKENLTRVLNCLWSLLLRMISDSLVHNQGVSREFYGRFHFTVEALVEFFHAEGEGLQLEELRNENCKALEKELSLNKCSSNELIEHYCLQKMAQQRTLKHSRFGCISLKCYYEALEQRLTVEVLQASDLIALDANGLSDPFVIVELLPHHVFPSVKSQRTQVKPMTLHPVFEEVFYFHVTLEQCRNKCACLLLTVMDYDWLSTNDFAGEAIAPLVDFCGSDRSGALLGGRGTSPVLLYLSQPKPSDQQILKMLEARTTDKEAQEFVRKQKEIEKSMGDN